MEPVGSQVCRRRTRGNARRPAGGRVRRLARTRGCAGGAARAPQRTLPEYMLPQESFSRSLTANAQREDRSQALPKPERVSSPDSQRARRAARCRGGHRAIWREVLERSDVGITDNFFDLGGHSLLTSRLGKLKSKVTRPVSRSTSCVPTIARSLRFSIRRRMRRAVAGRPIVLQGAKRSDADDEAAQ